MLFLCRIASVFCSFYVNKQLTLTNPPPVKMRCFLVLFDSSLVLQEVLNFINKIQFITTINVLVNIYNTKYTPRGGLVWGLKVNMAFSITNVNYYAFIIY